MNYKIIKTFFLFIFLVSFIFGETVKIVNKKDNFVSDIQTLESYIEAQEKEESTSK